MSRFEQWVLSKNSVNWVSGCGNDCVYCYSKGMAVRYKRKTEDNWKEEVIREHDVKKKRKLVDGLVGFCTSHDLTENNLESGIIVLRKLLEAGNQVLVISKPKVNCIKRVCEEFVDYKDKILFRFTIGAADDGILKVLEPGAPSFIERVEALKLAFDEGFGTSVSMEPLLEKEAVYSMIGLFKPMVTETVWIGRLNWHPRLFEKYPTIATKEDIEVMKEKLKDVGFVKFKK